MNNTEEKVIAVVDPTEIADETKLKKEVTDIEIYAKSIVVADDEQYASAGEFGTILKTKMAEVMDFFAPMKKAAHEAHTKICNKEKETLTPLKNAEAILKRTMGDYAYKKELERRKAEEEARRLAREEAERKLAEAIEAEAKSDTKKVEDKFIEAQVADQMARNITIESEKPTAKGVSTKTDYRIVSIDSSKVPIDVAGIIIRPVDEAAVLRLIRQTKGQIKIDGVQFEETVSMSFRKN